MLNKAKLVQQLDEIAPKLFVDRSHEHEIIRNVWQEIVQDPTFGHKIRAVDAPWPVPFWQSNLGDSIPVCRDLQSYHIISVDGSQIYPDRHQSVPCFLINIGSVSLSYNHQTKPVLFDSVPYLFHTQDPELPIDFSPEIVNCKRQQLELHDGLVSAQKHITNINNALLVFDGSLIFWHLEAKDPMLRDLFLPHYLATLCQLKKHEIITAGYISFPKSRELINLIRLQLSNFDPNNDALFHLVDGMVDATIAGFYLKPYERTIVFQNNSNVSDSYSDAVRPHFFYLHVGHEIARVEIPAWIAHDEQKLNFVAAALLDQSVKGRGYPVVLAEAHEQAVVKGPDREFFYHLLHKMGIERKFKSISSHKAMRKRSMNV